MYDIFKDREDDLADKQFFFGKLPFEVSDVYDWNKHMELLNTHQYQQVQDRVELLSRETLCS